MGAGEWLTKAVMGMYKKSRIIVRTKDGNCEEFDVKFEMHQGYVLSPLLFLIVLEALTS